MKTQGIVGTIVMAAGGMCPLVHVPVMGNWNYFEIDLSLALIFYVLVLLGLVASFMQKPGLIRFTGWAIVTLVMLTLIAVYFKSHNYFSFIHFKKLIHLAAGVVKYKWGWFIILAGTLMLITVQKKKIKVDD